MSTGACAYWPTRWLNSSLLKASRIKRCDTIQENHLKPWQKRMWCIPEASAAYVAAMEEVLDLYETPYNAQRPVVCFDETSKQLIAEIRTPQPVQPGRRPAPYDYEYKRNRTRNPFMFLEPLANYRHVDVTQRRTRQDFGRCVRWLTDQAYPDARVIHVVLDNLNTHTPAALYEAFAPAEARRIMKRLHFHYTPKHGSWLNSAKIEFGVFSRLRRNRRIPSAESLQRQVYALEVERNRKQATVNWQFTTEDARLKLKCLHPSLSD